jgi:hypothetical protein
MKTCSLIFFLVVLACLKSRAQYTAINGNETNLIQSLKLISKNNEFVAPFPQAILPAMTTHLAVKRPIAINWKRENLLVSRIALTGLALVASRIPQLIRSFKLRQKGLSLCSQKTTYGSFNKARKKVMGITWAIPIR